MEQSISKPKACVVVSVNLMVDEHESVTRMHLGDRLNAVKLRRSFVAKLTNLSIRAFSNNADSI